MTIRIAIPDPSEEAMTTGCQKSIRAKLGMINRPCDICGTGECEAEAMNGFSAGDLVRIKTGPRAGSFGRVQRALDTGFIEVRIALSAAHSAWSNYRASEIEHVTAAEASPVCAKNVQTADEQALKDAVVAKSEALKAAYDRANSRVFECLEPELSDALSEFGQSVDALRAHCTPPPARCEPPEWAKGQQWHWLAQGADDEGIFPACWHDRLSFWSVTRSDEEFTREQAANNGWRYYSIAKPSPQAVPTDEAIAELLEGMGTPRDATMHKWCKAAILRALTKFSRPTVEISDDAINRAFGFSGDKTGQDGVTKPQTISFTQFQIRSCARALISQATGQGAE